MVADVYGSAERLRVCRDKRREWYRIRMEMVSAASMPFAFLQHSQSKVLGSELAHGDPLPEHRRLSRLFTRVNDRCVLWGCGSRVRMCDYARLL